MSKRWRILATACTLVVGGGSLISFGVLAAWHAYSENPNASVRAATVLHDNRANPAGAPPGSLCTPLTSPASCSPILPAPGAATFVAPSGSVTGSVTVKNSGGTVTLMTLSSAAVASGTSCADLTLKVTDSGTATVIYNGAMTLAAPVSLPGSAGASWAVNESHGYTVAVSAAGNANHNRSACAFPARWLQTLGGWTVSTTNANTIDEVTRPNALTLTNGGGTSSFVWSPQVSSNQTGYGCTYLPASQTRCNPLTVFQGFANYNGNAYTYNAALTPGQGYDVVIDIQSIFPQQTSNGTFDCSGTTGVWVCTAY